MQRFDLPKNPSPEDIERFRRLLAGSNIEGIHSFIGVPRVGEPYSAGTLAPLLHPGRGLATSAGGLLVPTQSDFRYLQAFLGLREYVGVAYEDEGMPYSADLWIELLLKQHPADILVAELAYLNHVRGRKIGEALFTHFRGALRPDIGAALDQAMQKSGGGTRVFLARQPILRAMRLALLYEEEVDNTFGLPSWVVAILLTHAVAETLYADTASGNEFLPGIPAELAMEVMANYSFNQVEDPWTRLDRFRDLWGHYGPKVKPEIKLRAAPDALVQEAAGVDRADLFAVGMSFIARLINWRSGQPFRWAPRSDLGRDPALFDACQEWLAADWDQLRDELGAATGAWQLLPFEEHPIVNLRDGGCLVLDVDYLWERITSGLYWIVHNHEEPETKRRTAWAMAYGDMWEQWAEDRLRAMAPPALGGGRTFYTEDDLAVAYGGKTPDAAIDFGDAMVLCDVQKGQLSLPARQEGDLAAFIRDTDRIVMDKVVQLDEAAKAILKDPEALLGYKPPRYRIQPVVIAPGSYPVNPLSTEYIEVERQKRNLLTGAGINPLAVIDAGELEMLEALSARKGVSMLDALENWKKSGGFRYSLRNFLIQKYGSGPEMRPPRMDTSVDDLVDDIIRRLKPLDSVETT